MEVGSLLADGSTQNTSKLDIPANKDASPSYCGTDRLKCVWSGDLWTEQAVSFIMGAPTKQPWLLYLSYTAPHAGGIGTNKEGQPPVPRISSGPYANRSAELGEEIGYASAVTEIDRQLGLVLAALDEAGIANDTVVFFASE